MKKIVLIDGNAIIHRAYHAIPKTLHTRKGEQTNAVYGFATTLIKVLEDLKPSYIAASFDLAGPTFRHEQYQEYKATRVKADQELYDQIPRVKELVDTFGIPIYEMHGFEADDVIGTITKQIQNLKPKNQITKSETIQKNEDSSQSTQNDNEIAKKLTPNDYNLEIFIVSGDKDIFQLIDGNVRVYNLKKGLSQTQIVDAEVIQQEYNLQPEDFIDLKALAGDPSDNIPGVPGIGPKTATQLLQDFDTVEKLYDLIANHLDKIGIISKSEFLMSNKISNDKFEDLEIEKFIENWKLKIENYTGEINEISKNLSIKSRILSLLIIYYRQALFSQYLATIHKDVPIEFDLDKTEFGNYDKEKLRELFEELGFQSLLRRLGASVGDDKVDDVQKQSESSEQLKKDQQLKLL